MDNRIRLNEYCIVGHPRCDYTFSSTRECFIAYGFKQSGLEKDVLIDLLNSKNIQAIEAGGNIASGQNVFCSKICSRIITSQFCIVLLNNDEVNGNKIPNANVNMEYGLMLGLNKYVIPFQREDHDLPFNVAGIETIKYNNSNFKRQASAAIDKAITTTQQNKTKNIDPNQDIISFLLIKKMLLAPLFEQGEKILSDLGNSLGYLLLNDFSGSSCAYFGNFVNIRADAVILRIRLLCEILSGRIYSFPERVRFGLATAQQAEISKELFKRTGIWVLVANDEVKSRVATELLATVDFKLSIFTTHEVETELQASGLV